MLGESIGIGLEGQQLEASVGPYRADILCRSTSDDSLVLIESQLKRTDHSHLGRLLTFAAGLDAFTLVWVVERFTEEHRAAMDWLHRITEDGFHFFGVEVELWRIGDSVPAPKFNVVVKPNDWAKTVREQGAATESSATEALRPDYWRGFAAHLEDAGSKLKLQSPSNRLWANLSIGRAGVHLPAVVSVRERFVCAKVYFKGPRGLRYFQLLEEQRQQIDRELGEVPTWEHSAGGKNSQIHLWRDADPSDRTSWLELFKWTREKLEALDRVFRARIA